MSAPAPAIAKPSSHSGESVLCAVERHSLDTPDALAVSTDSSQLTYRQLNANADRLADQLRSLNVGKEVVVGLCFPRSAALVVGALAVLKAGGAYLPIDPKIPKERLAFMLQDAGVRVLIAPECERQGLPSGSWEVIGLSPGGENGLQDCPAAHTAAASPEDLAYVIYTSGSTGTPKGVEVTRGNLDNLVHWHQRAFGVTASDRATLIASPGFDAAVWELWPYLATGASVHIPGESIRTSPAELRDWMVARGITISFLPTALAERMLDLDWPAPGHLRYLLTGADTLRRRPPAGLPFRLVNNYGPTECTVVATSGVVDPNGDSKSLPPIGSPIDGLTVEIRDGELYVGGSGVARGYRNRPELTAERFQTDLQRGIRFYRTGDLARWLPDGQIAFEGRVDDQIKIRGFRIEPGEIVQALCRIPAVRDGAVVEADAGAGEKRLVAYVVAKPGAVLSDRALRTALRDHLPDYMIPSGFMVLDAIPSTENGKVDRARLPLATPENCLRDDEFIAPSTPLETSVATILCDLLRVERLGLRDNFFLLGGHSLLGTQLIERVNKTFGVELPLLAVFENPTIGDLAETIEKAILARLESMSEDEAVQLVGA